MKNLALFTVIFILVISCKKTKEITYPPTMEYGDNVLAIDTDTISNLVNYSFGAELGKNASLKVVLTNLSVQTNPALSKPVWFYSNEQGWIVSDYSSDDTQTFTSNKDGRIILDISFSDTLGSCKIDYYENSKSVTKTKYLSWQDK